MTRQFDAITYAQELEAAGVPKAQAEVHAKTLSHALSDSAVLPEQLSSAQQHLEDRIEGARHELTAKIEDTEHQLTVKIERACYELTGRIDRLETELHSVKQELEAKIESVRVELGQRIRQLMWVQGAILTLIIGLYVQLLAR